VSEEHPTPASAEAEPAAGPAAPPRAWGLGELAAVLAVVLAATGLVLVFGYRPTFAHAYFDVVEIERSVIFGVARRLHFWAAHFLVIAVALHLLRQFLVGGHRYARDWRLGWVLLVGTVALAATGALLPLDVEAMRGFAELWGGEAGQPEESALFLAYTLHCFALPLAMAGLLVAHFRRARRKEGR